MYDKASIALIPSGYKAGSTDNLYSVLPANGDGDFNATRGSTATRVNKDGLIESVAADVPRLDYRLNNGVVGDCPHLLLETSRTNVVPYSEQFDNSSWGKTSMTVTPNAAISPDGTQTADKIIPSSASTTHQIYDLSLISSQTCATSVFAKADGINTFEILDGSSAVNGAFFNLSDGTFTNKGSGVGSMIYYGNGWYRCIVISTTTGFRIYCPTSASNASGDGTSGVLLWGAQLEVGSYPTSYIKTQGEVGGVTRSADVCNKTGVESLLGQTEGTLFLEFVPLDTSALQILFQIRTTGFTNVGQVDIRYQSGQIRALGSDNNGTTVFNILGGSITAGTNYKAAIRYKTNDAKFYINGSSVGTDTSCSFTSSTKQQISFAENLTSFLPSIKVKQAIVFDEALSDSELQTLTS